MKIFLDAGHGGSDPGAIGRKSHEADINLMLTEIIGRILTEQNQTVVHSRLTDKYLTLSQRAYMSNKAQCNVYVSIHCNSFNKASHGVETFSYPNSTEGMKLSKIVQEGLIEVTGLTDRGSKTANFGVLRMSKATAILIETAFISNPTEENLLLSEAFREKVSDSIVRSLLEYLKVPYIDKIAKKSNKLYHVQLGAFGVKSNADNLVKELEKKGYKPFVKFE